MRRITLKTAVLALATLLPFSSAMAAQSFSLDNGVRVLVETDIPNDVVAMRTYILGGAGNADAATAGIEALWLNTALRASQDQSREQVSRRCDEMGIEFFAQAGKDYSQMGMQVLAPLFGKGLALYLDLLLRPALAPEDLEVTRQQLVAAFMQKLDGPDGRLTHEFNQKFYAGHPYAALEEGTRESLETITREQVLAHKDRVLAGRNLLVVVVGKVDVPRLKDTLAASLGTLPAGDAVADGGRAFAPEGHAFPLVAAQDLPTTYILGKFNAPPPGHPDWFPLKLGMTQLGRQLWEKVRTNEGLAYAVMGGLSAYRSNYGYFYASTVDPTRTMDIIRACLDNARQQGFNADELARGKSVFRTSYYMEMESNSDLADMMAFATLYLGGWHGAGDLLKPLDAVDAAQVKDVLNRYLGQVWWGSLGAAHQGFEPAAAPTPSR